MQNINLFSINKVFSKIYQKVIFFFYDKQIIEDELTDIAEYLSLSVEKLLTRAKIKDTVSESILWNEKKRMSTDDYRDYYSKNIHYLERQDYYNLNHPRLLMEFRKLKKNAKILDYGCGTAMLAFNAKKTRNNLKIFLADIPEAVTKKYVFWRFKKHNLDFNWIDIPNNELIEKSFKFDLIRCHDVLEHSFHPLKVMKFFYNSLNNDGFITFDYLKSNRIEKEVTFESQKSREEVMNFVKLNFKIIYSYKNKYVVKKK